jgi:LPS-assembly protein
VVAAFAPRVIRRVAFLIAFGALVSVGVSATPTVGSAVKIDTDSQDVDAKTGEVTLKGHVRIADDTTVLLADEGRYNSKTEVITVAGHVVLTRGALRLLADRVVVHRRDETFEAEHIRLGEYPYYVEGQSASGTRTDVVVLQAKVTYGEPGPWQPAVSADKVIFSPGRRLQSEHSFFGIGHVRPLPFPKFEQSLAEPLLSYVSLGGGYRGSLGAFGEAGLHLPVKPGVRLGGDLGYYSARGVLFGPSGNYTNPADPESLRGYFRSGYINDHGAKGVDILGRPVPENRGFVEWQHRQDVTEHLSVAAQVNWWKDSEVVRDFRPRSFFPVQEPDTFVESVYAGDNYFVSAFGRFQPNTFHRVQQRLPEVRFDLLPVALGHGFYHRFNASAAVLRDDPPLNGPELRSNRLDGYYALMRPIAPSDWLTITPIAGERVTDYTNTRGASRGDGRYTRVLGELGADAELRASGDFGYRNERWQIDGLRHLFTPRLSYRYIPEAERGRAYIPAIDREAFSTYLPPLGLGEVRNIDDLHATNTLRLSLNNTLQTRDPQYGSRDLLTLNIADDFRFKRRPGERDLSELQAELAASPARWIEVGVFGSVSPQSLTLRELNTGVTIRDGNAWSFRFANNFLRHQLQDYLLDGRIRINEALEAVTRLRYDQRKHRFNEQAYGLEQNLANTWRISYLVSLYSGPRRESHFGLSIQIDTIRF